MFVLDRWQQRCTHGLVSLRKEVGLQVVCRWEHAELYLQLLQLQSVPLHRSSMQAVPLSAIVSHEDISERQSSRVFAIVSMMKIYLCTYLFQCSKRTKMATLYFRRMNMTWRTCRMNSLFAGSCVDAVWNRLIRKKPDYAGQFVPVIERLPFKITWWALHTIISSNSPWQRLMKKLGSKLWVASLSKSYVLKKQLETWEQIRIVVRINVRLLLHMIRYFVHYRFYMIFWYIRVSTHTTAQFSN